MGVDPRGGSDTRTLGSASRSARGDGVVHGLGAAHGGSDTCALGSGSRGACGDGGAFGPDAARSGSDEWDDGKRRTLMAANTERGRPLYPAWKVLDHCAPVLYNLHYRHNCI